MLVININATTSTTNSNKKKKKKKKEEEEDEEKKKNFALIQVLIHHRHILGICYEYLHENIPGIFKYISRPAGTCIEA